MWLMLTLMDIIRAEVYDTDIKPPLTFSTCVKSNINFVTFVD